jgi:hypothetical protein
MIVPPRSSIDSGRFHRDDLGRLDEISGSDPQDVLVTYCAVAGNEKPYTPLEISDVEPPQDGVKLGIFRESARGRSKQAIRIWRGNDSEVWFAGGKGEPITAVSMDRP